MCNSVTLRRWTHGGGMVAVPVSAARSQRWLMVYRRTLMGDSSPRAVAVSVATWVTCNLSPDSEAITGEYTLSLLLFLKHLPSSHSSMSTRYCALLSVHCLFAFSTCLATTLACVSIIPLLQQDSPSRHGSYLQLAKPMIRHKLEGNSKYCCVVPAIAFVWFICLFICISDLLSPSSILCFCILVLLTLQACLFVIFS